MTQEAFARLFADALDRARSEAERRLGRPVPRLSRVWLHGAGHAGDLLDPDRVGVLLYLGEDRFYRIIDVAVAEVDDRATTYFVRVSAHHPGSFAETWDTPPGSGPFKQLQAVEIKVVAAAPPHAKTA